MRRFVILCWVIAGSVTTLILFQIKQEVRGLEQEISQTNSAILRDQEALHILEAEWSYLNSPARLAALAARHLDMAPIPAAHIVAFDGLPLPGDPAGDGTAAGEDAPPPGPATLVKALTEAGTPAEPAMPAGGLTR